LPFAMSAMAGRTSIVIGCRLPIGRDHGPEMIEDTSIGPFPGTLIFDELRADDPLSTEDYSRFTAVEPVIDCDRMGIGRKAVVRKLAKAYVSFYLRPSYVLRHPYMLSMIPQALFPRSDRSRDS